MPRYLIERTVPGAHEMSPEELREAACTSCETLTELGPQIQWVQSFISEDRITCVYIAPGPEMIREHAKRSGFPADNILLVHGRMDPTTAEPAPAARATAGR